MRYFTKEWYLMKRRIGLGNMFVVDDEAEVCSLEYFNRLYALREIEYLKSNQDSDFDVYLEGRVEYLKEVLPRWILVKVKDIRIMAMGCVTQDVYDEIKIYAEKCKGEVDSAYGDYQKEFESNFPVIKPLFGVLPFKDCIVTKIKKFRNDLIMYLDNSASLSDVTVLRFRDALTGEQILDVMNARWISNEIYKDEESFSIHILLESDELRELVFNCKEVVLV